MWNMCRLFLCIWILGLKSGLWLCCWLCLYLVVLCVLVLFCISWLLVMLCWSFGVGVFFWS